MLRLTLTCLVCISVLGACTPSRTRNWRDHGVRIVHSDELDLNTPQTSGMTRAVAINHAMAGAMKLWAGRVTVEAGVESGPHHHGELESIGYILRGKARMRWGEHLEYVADAGPGDFIFVPPFVPHQEINAGDEPLEVVLIRSGKEPIVVNLDIPGTDSPEEIRWDNGFHRRP